MKLLVLLACLCAAHLTAKAVSILEGASQTLLPVDEGVAKAGDEFGKVIATSGGTLIAGVPRASITGRAYVYVKTPANGWQLEAELAPPPDSGITGFGSVVAIDGDLAAVGQLYNKTKICLFRRSGTTWALETILSSPVTPTNGFGASISISGNAVLVGDTDRKRADVFRKIGTTWAHEALLPAPSRNLLSPRGTLVLIRGNVAVVVEAFILDWYHWDGASWIHDREVKPAQYLTSKPTSLKILDVRLNETHQLLWVLTTWGQVGAFSWPSGDWAQIAIAPPTSAHLGTLGAITTAGDTLWIAGLSRTLAYLRSASGSWQPAPVGSNAFGASFASQLSMSDNEVLWGDFNDPGFSGSRTGRVRVLEHGSGGSLQFGQVIRRADMGIDGARFGTSVATSAQWLAVGSPGQVNAAGLRAGAISLYSPGTSGSWEPNAVLRATDGGYEALLGASVALDAQSVLAGAPGADGRTGAVYVFSKEATGWTQKQKLTPPTSLVNQWWGQEIVIVGPTALVRGDSYVATLERNSAGVWAWTGVLPLPMADPYLLSGLSYDGTWAAVKDEGSHAVLVFKRGPSGWAFHSQLQVAPQIPQGPSARSLCISGSLLMVGMVEMPSSLPITTDPTNTIGKVWCYTLQGNAWKLTKVLSQTGTSALASSAAFGLLLAAQGNQLFVQSIHRDPTATTSNGESVDLPAIDVYDRSFRFLTRLIAGNTTVGNLTVQGSQVYVGEPYYSSEMVTAFGRVLVANLAGLQLRRGTLATSPPVPSGETLDLGLMAINKARTESLRIQNTGVLPLTGITTQISNDPSGAITVDPLPRTTLNPGESMVVRVVVKSAEATNLNARVSFKAASFPNYAYSIGFTATVAIAKAPVIEDAEGNEQTVEIGTVDAAPSQLSVNATGTDPLRYQWYRNGVPIPGATGPAYSTAPVKSPAEAGLYMLRVTNDFGTAQSRVWHVNVYRPVERTVRPTAGRTLTLAVEAYGPGPYFWSDDYNHLSDGAFVQGSSTPQLRLARPRGVTYTLQAGGKSLGTFAVEAPDTTRPNNIMEEFLGEGLAFEVGQNVKFYLGTQGDELSGVSAQGLPPGLLVRRLTRQGSDGAPVMEWFITGKPTTAGYFATTFVSSRAGVASAALTLPVQVQPKNFSQALDTLLWAEELSVGRAWWLDLVPSLPYTPSAARPLVITGLPPGIRLVLASPSPGEPPTWQLTGVATAPGFYKTTVVGYDASLVKQVHYLPLKVRPMPLGSVGTFAGLIDPHDVFIPEGGSFSITTTSAGTFSGSFTLGAQTTRVAGQFDQRGNDAVVDSAAAILPWKLPGFSMPFVLRINAGAGGVLLGVIGAGTVSDAETSGINPFAMFFGRSLKWSTRSPVPADVAGTYDHWTSPLVSGDTGYAFEQIESLTSLSSGGSNFTGGSWGGGIIIGGSVTLGRSSASRSVARNEATPAPPAGIGYGWTLVASNGAVITSGKLADGSPVRAIGFLDSEYTALIHLPATTRSPGLHGAIKFWSGLDSTETARPDGKLLWTRAPGSGALWPQGFHTAITLEGERFQTPTAGVNPFGDFAYLGTSGTCYFAYLNADFTMGADHRLQLAPSAYDLLPAYGIDWIQGFNVNVNARTGIFSGRFRMKFTDTPPPTGDTLVEGLIRPHFGGGFILGPGSVSRPIRIPVQ